jgi:hypothetical protein
MTVFLSSNLIELLSTSAGVFLDVLSSLRQNFLYVDNVKSPETYADLTTISLLRLVHECQVGWPGGRQY